MFVMREFVAAASGACLCATGRTARCVCGSNGCVLLLPLSFALFEFILTQPFQLETCRRFLLGGERRESVYECMRDQ